ncbi:myo-inositol 2-dehydrogenase-like isoform X2 [Brienomyrus brachyistius]|uniref:myo-inositol 2-dehydrogenase-like isoform X2 n=1 Tax=Brienomyrus brachyistius TaxID=42636 RepID=UPI0020B450A5|nr:myo-inositol 2-dehydrogenase-like isoform X2 [Brienomyrus brachyistius]XP_048871970.1 myo-inositol 2-dehydrogenase-like isoform X2 [Brienomyrus brachyistius]
MGRKKKTLHDYAAEFSDLGVKRQLVEQHNSGERTVLEILYCKSCEIPVRVRRDRILEHLASARHFRNRRLAKLWDRKPSHLSPEVEAPPGSPGESDSTSPLALQSKLILAGNCCSSSSLVSRSCPPSQSASGVCSGGSPKGKGVVTPSVSAPRTCGLGLQASGPRPRLLPPDVARPAFGGWKPGGFGTGLAVFGAGSGSTALCRSLLEESRCQLLYVVDDQRREVEGLFSQERLAHTMLLRAADADVVLSDPRVTGVIVCSPPNEASAIVLRALRAGKGVFCERLPSLDRNIAESCFDEADRRGRPLVCGFYKRFDPALQYLYKRVNENDSLGRIQKISAVSRLYPQPSVAAIRSSGGIFHGVAVHDIDIICWMLGETIPDTVFSLGHAFCAELASLNDADAVSVSMKFPSGAIASLDVSQHCNKSCDQRLEVYGSEGSLQMENRNPLGISDHSRSPGPCPQSAADRFRDAHGELLRHFLRTLRGREAPFFSKEQYLWTVQVAAAAEQSWKNGSAVDLRHMAANSTTTIKTEA